MGRLNDNGNENETLRYENETRCYETLRYENENYFYFIICDE